MFAIKVIAANPSIRSLLKLLWVKLIVNQTLFHYWLLYLTEQASQLFTFYPTDRMCRPMMSKYNFSSRQLGVIQEVHQFNSILPLRRWKDAFHNAHVATCSHFLKLGFVFKEAQFDTSFYLFICLILTSLCQKMRQFSKMKVSSNFTNIKWIFWGKITFMVHTPFKLAWILWNLK